MRTAGERLFLVLKQVIAAFIMSGVCFFCNSNLLDDIQEVEDYANSVIHHKVTGVTATTSPGTLSLTWTSLPTATGYYVYYNTTPGQSLQGQRASGINTSTTTLSLSAATYYISISAYDRFGESTPSNEITATIP